MKISAKDPYFASQPLEHDVPPAQKIHFATKPRGALAKFAPTSMHFWHNNQPE
jgi:hypothetical protein